MIDKEFKRQLIDILAEHKIDMQPTRQWVKLMKRILKVLPFDNVFQQQGTWCWMGLEWTVENDKLKAIRYT